MRTHDFESTRDVSHRGRSSPGRPIASAAALLVGALSIGCDPLGPLPGGQLDGEQSSSPPGDWSSSGAYETVQLEVRPADPYSVNVWCAASGGDLYVGAGDGASAAWARALPDDGRARVRIGGVLYDVTATRVTSFAEIDAYLEVLAQKYEGSEAQRSDFQVGSDGAPPALLFRLDTSPPGASAL